MGVFPVRVLLHPELTATELCQTLQDQDTDGIADEIIDPDELWGIRGWEEDSPFTLLGHVKGGIESQLTLDGTHCGLHISNAFQNEALTMCVVKTWGHQAHISIAPRPPVALPTVEEAIDLFCCETAGIFARPEHVSVLRVLHRI